MSIRFEDRLDGVSNYLRWKVRISAILKENKIWKYVNTVVIIPTDPINLDVYEVQEARAQRVILDGVKDHLIPHLFEKQTAHETRDTLKKLYEAKNENRKMALRDKLHSVVMVKDENVSSYLTRVAQVKDELAAVGDVIADSKLVRIALKGFGKEWDVFVKCVVGREKLPDWNKLWDDFTQEEIREGSHSKQLDVDIKENVGVITKTKNKKKGKDLNKVKCYTCNQYGHYASKCPNKKEQDKNDVVATTSVEEFATKFEREFSLVSFDSSVDSSNLQNAWIVDSGSTRHMTDMWEVF